MSLQYYDDKAVHPEFEWTALTIDSDLVLVVVATGIAGSILLLSILEVMSRSSQQFHRGIWIRQTRQPTGYVRLHTLRVYVALEPPTDLVKFLPFFKPMCTI